MDGEEAAPLNGAPEPKTEAADDDQNELDMAMGEIEQELKGDSEPEANQAAETSENAKPEECTDASEPQPQEEEKNVKAEPEPSMPPGNQLVDEALIFEHLQWAGQVASILKAIEGKQGVAVVEKKCAELMEQIRATYSFLDELPGADMTAAQQKARIRELIERIQAKKQLIAKLTGSIPENI